MYADSADMVTVYLFYFFQLLNLLEVIIDSAGSKLSPSDKLPSSTSEPSSGPQISAMEEDANTDPVVMSSAVDKSAKAVASNPESSENLKECETQRVLSDLPQAELRLLCSLLAQEGYDNRFMLVKLHLSLVFLSFPPRPNIYYCLSFVNMLAYMYSVIITRSSCLVARVGLNYGKIIPSLLFSDCSTRVPYI